MDKPKFEVQRAGAKGVELVIRNSLYSAELHSIINALGYEPTAGVSNRESIFCTTAEQIEAARNPIARFFNARGEWI